MSDLESPEVPLQLAMPVTEAPKKKGFFKRLFSRGSSDSEPIATALPSIDISSFELPTNDIQSDAAISSAMGEDENAEAVPEGLPSLPSIAEQLEEGKSDGSAAVAIKPSNILKGKHKKGQKRKLGKVNESSQFDWSREIKEQEILVHDSNRFNQDVNILVKQADKHIDEKTPIVKGNMFMSRHREIQSDVEPVDIEELKMTPPVQEEDSSQMMTIDAQHHRTFVKIANNHNKLRKTLKKYLADKLLFNNRARFAQLLKEYDNSVEGYIEEKELELAKKKQHIEKAERNIKAKEKDAVNMYAYIKGLDSKLTEREANINNIISKNVEEQLSRRMREERKLLGEELKKTSWLNADLKKKIKITEDDRIRFEREHQRMSDTERKKLNGLQAVYEQKLKELETEKKAFYEEKRIFENRRQSALDLMGKANIVSKNIAELRQMKDSIDKGKKTVEKELYEDKELKDALASAEATLSQEKQNLDGMIFNKYIENNLKSIKPEYLESKQDWKNELQTHPLYDQIEQCRQMLLQRKLTEAKTIYNVIRKAYEQVPDSSKEEKEALYTAIRELYNDIQIKVVEAQMHTQ
jgi:hypothetical protein